MEVSFTSHYSDPADVDMFMAVASRQEWLLVLLDLRSVKDPNAITDKLIDELEGWGIV